MEIVTRGHPDALELLRHDCAHVMAEAVQELYPGTQVTFGPAIENGFYYDFARDEPFTPDDLERIEARMHEIVKRERGDRPRGLGPARRRSAFFPSRRARSIRPSTSQTLPPDGEDHLHLPPGRLARPLHRAAPAVDRASWAAPSS